MREEILRGNITEFNNGTQWSSWIQDKFVKNVNRKHGVFIELSIGRWRTNQGSTSWNTGMILVLVNRSRLRTKDTRSFFCAIAWETFLRLFFSLMNVCYDKQIRACLVRRLCLCELLSFFCWWSTSPYIVSFSMNREVRAKDRACKYRWIPARISRDDEYLPPFE